MRGPLVIALLLAVYPAMPLAQPTVQASETTLTVELSNFKFTPERLTLRQGEHYRIRFVNVVGKGHDFVAREFFASSTLSPEDSAKIDKGRVRLRGGESVEVALTPNRAGVYKVHCSHFMHSAFGMTGSIVVR